MLSTWGYKILESGRESRVYIMRAFELRFESTPTSRPVDMYAGTQRTTSNCAKGMAFKVC